MYCSDPYNYSPIITYISIPQHHIQRVKLRTSDNNDIEAFYKDNRRSSDAHGQILVICCEGNAGFPELGNPKIPLEKNYSVIGWNHPGFGGSTVGDNGL